MITDGYGLVVERRSYDTWGKQRNISWREEGDPSDVIQQAITNRGYTGHEHIEEVGLIHMNGRVYDEVLGRFLSADPMIQAPYATNSFNRYSYVMNNPLKYTDPTGFFWSEIGDAISDAWDSVKDFFGGDSNNGNTATENENNTNQENLEGDGLGFTFGYIGRAIGGLFGGLGNTLDDQVKMGGLTAEGQCKRGRCGESQLQRLGVAADRFGRNSSFNRSWNHWANRLTDGVSYNLAAVNSRDVLSYSQDWLASHGLSAIKVIGGSAQVYSGSALLAAGVVACTSGAGCLAGAPMIAGGFLLSAHGSNNVLEALTDEIGPIRKGYIDVLGPSVGSVTYSAIDVSISISGYTKLVSDPNKFSLFHSDKIRKASAFGIGFGVPADIDTIYDEVVDGN